MRTRPAVLSALVVASLGCTTLSVGQLRTTHPADTTGLGLVCGEFAEDSVHALNKRLDAIYAQGLRLAATGTVSHSLLGMASTWPLLCFEGPVSTGGIVDGRTHTTATPTRPARR